MGNIEIRDQSNLKRRTQIFTDRKSFDAARSNYRKSLTQRYDRSHYSPIGFSKVSDHPKQLPLTERKPNTNRSSNQNSCMYSQIMNQESFDDIKSPKQKLHFLKQKKIKNIEIKENYEQQNVLSTSQKTGKIVSNSNKRVQEERRNIETFKLLMNNQRPLGGPFETKEIIKKVRNFNDFLNQIKRKLKEDKQETLLRNKSRLEEFKKQQEEEKPILPQSKKNQPFINSKQEVQTQPNTIQKSRSMRRIQIALKLQNQKIELEKYRKLVERQLSKTHSIENISLCTKNSGQKILTIQYESILQQNMFPGQNEKKYFTKQASQKTLIHKIYDQDVINDRFKQLSQKEKEPSQIYDFPFQLKTIRPNKEESKLLKKLKIQYEKMLQNVLELGKTIEKYEKEGMRGSQFRDDKILIQEGSEVSKRESHETRRESQFSKKASQFSKKESSQKENFIEKIVSQFNKAQSQCSNKSNRQIQSIKEASQYSNRRSQCTKKDEIVRDQFEKTGSQCSRVESQHNRVESRQSRKESLCNKLDDQISKKSSKRDTLIRQNESQEISNFENLEHTFNSESKSMLKMENFHERQESKEKIERIESLFDKLNDLQQQYQETDRQIRQAIAAESFSDSPLEESSSFL